MAVSRALLDYLTSQFAGGGLLGGGPGMARDSTFEERWPQQPAQTAPPPIPEWFASGLMSAPPQQSFPQQPQQPQEFPDWLVGGQMQIPSYAAPPPPEVRQPVNMPISPSGAAPAPQAMIQPPPGMPPVPGGGYGMGSPAEAGFAGFANSGGGLLPAISNLIGGLRTGRRQDATGMGLERMQQQQSAIYNFARSNGADHTTATAMALDPNTNKMISAGYVPELQEIGTDPFTGNKKFAWKQSSKMQLTPIGGGQAGGAVLGGDLGQVPYNYNEKGVDEGFLKAVDDHSKILGADVRGVLAGQAPASGRNLQKLIELGMRADQNFTGMQDYNSRLMTAKSFGGGKDAETVKSYNQAIVHANKAWSLIPKIEGFNVGGIVGRAINAPFGEGRAAVSPQFASDRREYENLIQALSGELMKASRGAGSGSLEEIRAWKAGSLAANSGPEMRGAIRGGMDFLEGAMDASARKKSEGLKSQFTGASLLSDANRAAFHRIQSSDESGKPMGGEEPAKAKLKEDLKKKYGLQ